MESNHRLCFINVLPLYQLPTDLLNRHSWMVLTHSWLRKTMDKIFDVNFTIVIINVLFSCWKQEKVIRLPSGHRAFSCWKLAKSHLFWYICKTSHSTLSNGMFFKSSSDQLGTHILKPICPKRDLNSHGLLHNSLNDVCLPIPPLGQKLAEWDLNSYSKLRFT